jgi:tRNA(fMet)-specific endonuclease VapC
MRLIYLLDTNTISEPLKEKPNQQVIDKIQLFDSNIAIASVVVYKLFRGAYLLPESKKRSKTFDYIESVLLKFQVLNYTQEAAIWNGKENARLQQLGKPPSFIDAQIASIAYSNQLILVTRNVSDFQYFLDLTVENWF